MAGKFRIAVPRDFQVARGEAGEDIGFALMTQEPRVSYDISPEFVQEVGPEQIAGYDALVLGDPSCTRRTLGTSDLKLSIVARMGVGYEDLDVKALTEHDILLTNGPDGVRRPVAAAIVTLMLALGHELFALDKLVREVRWEDRRNVHGRSPTGRVVGIIGLGNIGAEVLRLLPPFDMVHIAMDPFVTPEQVADLNVELVDLENLMRRSDFVCITCPLTPETRGLIGQRELSMMKPTAFLINTARGLIVDQQALYTTLKERRIQGAALDVFAEEPAPRDNPLIDLENVILSPHAVGVTDQCLRGIGESAVRSVLTALRGDIPEHVVNREVLVRPGMKAKLKANRKMWLAHEEEGTR